MSERDALNKQNLALAPIVAQWIRAYLECSEVVQEIIHDMAAIITSEDADDDEKDLALATFVEALFPKTHHGSLGADLEELEQENSGDCDQFASLVEEMDRQEACFGERLRMILTAKQMTQEDLAKEIGVGQSAISMMINRQARPQMRTVEKIARALEIPVEQLWTKLS